MTWPSDCYTDDVNQSRRASPLCWSRVHTAWMRRLSGVVGASITSALLLGCGGSSTHKSAQNTQLEGLPPAPTGRTHCPSGKTLIRGHFHGEGCAPTQSARVAFICAEGGYELENIAHQTLRDPQRGTLRHGLSRAASESITALKRTATELTASGENDGAELASLAKHRAELAAYLVEVRHADPNVRYITLFRTLFSRDQGCESKLLTPATPG
jgi:hypothetical protein